jgi:hypothetical protein
MTPTTGNSGAGRWGAIGVVPLESREITGRAGGSGPLETDQHCYKWRPSIDLSPSLPRDYCVSMTAISHNGTCRRFHPTGEPYSFVLHASLGGFAILTKVSNLDAEQRNSYNAMRLLFQHGPLVREALNRGFLRIQDLFVGREGRIGSDYGDILPDTIGLDRSGQGKRLGIGDVIRAGKQEATLRGLRDPSAADFIRLGLLDASRLNPVDVEELTKDEAACFLRIVLFDLGPADVRIDESTAVEVVGRFLEALQPHLDDSDEEFCRWFFDNRDGIVHQISKRKSGPGAIPRAAVRQVLLEKTFESLRYTGQCIDIQMRVFADALEPALDDDERSVFEAIYFSQPWLGGIPLVLLHRYFGPIREAIQDLWLDPKNSQYQGVLLRVLEYHAEMVRKRREADRAAKRCGKTGRQVPLSDRPPATDETSLENQDFDLRELAAELGRASGLSCTCGAASDFQASFDFQGSSLETINVDFVCGRCGSAQRRTFFSDQVARIMSANGG